MPVAAPPSGKGPRRLPYGARKVIDADRTSQPRLGPCCSPGHAFVRRCQQADGRVRRLRSTLIQHHAAHACIGDARPGKAGNQTHHHVHLRHGRVCCGNRTIGQDQFAGVELDLPSPPRRPCRKFAGAIPVFSCIAGLGDDLLLAPGQMQHRAKP